MWIKICGIRDEHTATQVAALKPNAIGLNFYEPSPRCIDASIAAKIVESLPGGVEPVGLFVNHALAEVLSLSESARLGTIQLHGDESPEFLAALQESRPDLKILRAFRVGDDNLAEVADYLDECWHLQLRLSGVLIDSRVEGAYGGTGHTAPWDLLRDHYDADLWPPLILAGGLTPDNVAGAIRTTNPFGVDVSSGVEAEKGVKNLELVRQFIEAARTAADCV